MAFPYLESRLAEAVGISLKAFRQARRKMAAQEDFDLTDDGVAYSAKGFHAVLAALGVSSTAVDFEILQKKAAGPDATDLLPLALCGVVERFFTNRLLLGVRLDDKRLVKLRVAQGRDLFVKRMRVRVRPAGPELFELATALPRRKGKW